MFSTSEAASLMGVSTSTVKHWADKSGVTPTKFAHVYVYSVDDVTKMSNYGKDPARLQALADRRRELIRAGAEKSKMVRQANAAARKEARKDTRALLKRIEALEAALASKQ